MPALILSELLEFVEAFGVFYLIHAFIVEAPEASNANQCKNF